MQRNGRASRVPGRDTVLSQGDFTRCYTMTETESRALADAPSRNKWGGVGAWRAFREVRRGGVLRRLVAGTSVAYAQRGAEAYKGIGPRVNGRSRPVRVADDLLDEHAPLRGAIATGETTAPMVTAGRSHRGADLSTANRGCSCHRRCWRMRARSRRGRLRVRGSDDAGLRSALRAVDGAIVTARDGCEFARRLRRRARAAGRVRGIEGVGMEANEERGGADRCCGATCRAANPAGATPARPIGGRAA